MKLSLIFPCVPIEAGLATAGAVPNSVEMVTWMDDLQRKGTNGDSLFVIAMR